MIEAAAASPVLVAAQDDQRVVLERESEDARHGVGDRDDLFRCYIPQRRLHFSLEAPVRPAENRDHSRLTSHAAQDFAGLGQIEATLLLFDLRGTVAGAFRDMP
jgi:hypothetical protein